jgi:undecaprenyl-diphosphatase
MSAEPTSDSIVASGQPLDLEALLKTEASLERAIAEIRTPEHAEQVIAALERLLGDLKEHDVAEAQPARTAAQSAGAIEAAVDAAPREAKPAAALAQTAAEVAAAPPGEQRTLSEAVARATGQTGFAPAPSPETRRGRRLLRRALFRHLRPLEALDTVCYLQINHLPHPPVVDRVVSRFSWIMTGGTGWIAVLLLGLLQNRRDGWRATRGVLPALWLATSAVEYPIKYFFRRRRPFISVVRAIVVGRKPGSYSFPSGHSAAAFAGATLLTRYYPNGRPLWHFIASLVALSRIYLGAHYPGDVIMGSLSGAGLARVFHRGLRRLWPRVFR